MIWIAKFLAKKFPILSSKTEKKNSLNKFQQLRRTNCDLVWTWGNLVPVLIWRWPQETSPSLWSFRQFCPPPHSQVDPWLLPWFNLDFYHKLFHFFLVKTFAVFFQSVSPSNLFLITSIRRLFNHPLFFGRIHTFQDSSTLTIQFSAFSERLTCFG